VLFVLRAQAAIERAAPVRPGAEDARQARRLVKFMAVIVGNVRANEVLAGAMIRAMLAEVNAIVADDDLGVHQPAADGAKTPGCSEEGVVAEMGH